MPWPKGYTREQVAALPADQRKELFSKAKVLQQPVAEKRAQSQEPPDRHQRATRQEQPRAIQRANLEKQPKSTQRWTMKAGSNWESPSTADEVEDKFHIPREDFPEGMDLFWATRSIWGQEQNQRLNLHYRAGWTPVHKEDFDGRFANRFSVDDSGYVVQESSILCARPLELSIAARERNERRAKEQISMKEQAFKGGDVGATGGTHESAKAIARISRSMERIEIPKE